MSILRGRKLFAKIIGVLAAVVIVSLAVIGLSLLSSWRLEGLAAAINDVGSLRMGSWKSAYHLAHLPLAGAERTRHIGHLEENLSAMEAIQAGLERGDPKRPLLLPQDDGIPADVVRLGEIWRTRIKPLSKLVLASDPGNSQADAMRTYEAATDAYVAAINQVMVKMESSYASSTSVLRSFQVLLAALAVLGTLVLTLFFFFVVIRPVRELQEGMRRMEREDFAARVPVVAEDEFSELARGFNRMAVHLQNLYATLEERVETKTQRLNEINRELQIQYDISRFLGEPVGVEELSRGFLERVGATFGADAAAIRLFDSHSQNLFLATQQGMDENFIAREAVLRCGECLCGQAMLGDIPVVSDTSSLADGPTRAYCARAGFATVSAIPISHNKRKIGLFNLFFLESAAFSKGDQDVLQSLGQHLGMAIEGARLQSREREMAVSEERNLIARKLHDSIAQSLAYLNLQAQLLEQAVAEPRSNEVSGAVARIRRGIQEGYADVRELLQHFRTRFNQPDLDSAIRAALERFTEQGGVPADFTTHGVGPPFSAEVETQILYIFQEALSNVRKHAQAARVRVDLWRDQDGLRLDMTDDGIGFDQAADGRQTAGEHIGLEIMGERAVRIFAKLEIRSRPGEGTRVSLTLKRNEMENALA